LALRPTSFAPCTLLGMHTHTHTPRHACTHRSLRAGAGIGFGAIVLVIFLSGFGGWLAYAAGLINDSTNKNLYLMQVRALWLRAWMWACSCCQSTRGADATPATTARAPVLTRAQPAHLTTRASRDNRSWALAPVRAPPP
jgi:hypothetical protein